jgi:hypothetical protein
VKSTTPHFLINFLWLLSSINNPCGFHLPVSIAKFKCFEAVQSLVASILREKMMSSSIINIIRLACLLFLPFSSAQEEVNGYINLGRGSCIDGRGQFYSYIQRTLTFPDASTCGAAECAKFGNAPSFRGFEFSVTKRCTCLFDKEKMPPVQNDAASPDYVSKNYNGVDPIAGTSGTPGANCYMIAKDSAVTMGTGLFYVTTFATAVVYMFN